MKATLNELWDTGFDIVCYDNSEFDRITSFSDLSKCDNVILDNVTRTQAEAIIGNDLCHLTLTEVKHPQGGRMTVILA